MHVKKTRTMKEALSNKTTLTALARKLRWPLRRTSATATIAHVGDQIRVVNRRLSMDRRITLVGLIIGALCLGGPFPTIASPGSWVQMADLLANAAATTACVVDGILYVIGGSPKWPQDLATVWAYDPSMNAWTRKKDMPTARKFLAAAAVNGTIYVIGGYPGAVTVNTVEAYDPKTDSWATKAHMPTARGILAACALDGIVYAIGGTDAWPNRLSTVEAYDPVTNQWSKKSDLPQGMVFLTASVAGGSIYAFMGQNTFAYDAKTDHWTAKAQFSPWRYGLVSATVDGTIYLFGGMTEDLYISYDFVLAYDPASDRFSPKRKMLRTNILPGCEVIDGKVYLAGGISKEPAVHPDAVYYRTLDVFDPQGGVTPYILSLACESNNCVRLVWQGETGIRYGVQSTANTATGPWPPVTFSSGSTSVLATGSLVEATCLVPWSNTNRFFRVLER